MKKFFFFAIATLGMMVGCQKQEINNVQNPIDDSDRVAVQFNIDAPSLTVTKTKGAGPVEQWATSQTLYILGYDKDAESYESNASITDEKGNVIKTTLIPNIATTAPNGNTSGVISVKHPSGDTNAAGDSIEGEPYFYGDTRVYDFYGYYVDDAADPTDFSATATGVSIPVVIDGTQDIMVAKADAEKDIEFCTDERGRQISANNAYSAYAARRGVHPTLTFDHMLTRFNFYVVAGAESGTKVNVTKITLDSHTKADLSIAPTPGIKATSTEKTALSLSGIPAADATAGTEAGKTPYTNGTYTYVTKDLLDSDDAKIGNSIMAIAGETSHNIVLTTVFNKKSNPAGDPYKQDIKPLPITLNAYDIVTANGEPVEKFEAGYQYDVILTVYGPEEVKITAVLSEWKEGGNTVVDPDEWMEEPTDVSASLTAATATSLTYEITTPNNYVDGEAYLTDAAGKVLTEPFVPTKAKTAVVTFKNLTPDATYTFTVKVRTDANVDFKDVKAADVKIEAVASEVAILGGLYAYDKESYNQIPAYYRTKEGKSWSEYQRDYETWVAQGKPAYGEDCRFTPLPWLVVWYLPMEDEATITVNDKPVTFNIPAESQLATIALREIDGIDAFEPGETYTVKITSNGNTASVDIKIPEVEEPEEENPVVESIVKKSYVVVETEESYNQLPAAYRAAKGEWAKYQADLEASKEDPESEFHALPWLAVETTPNASATFVVSNGETHKTFNWTLGEIGLATFSADEVGVALEGDWTVTVTIGETTQTVEFTVPAPAAE